MKLTEKETLALIASLNLNKDFTGNEVSDMRLGNDVYIHVNGELKYEIEIVEEGEK